MFQFSLRSLIGFVCLMSVMSLFLRVGGVGALAVIGFVFFLFQLEVLLFCGLKRAVGPSGRMSGEAAAALAALVTFVVVALLVPLILCQITR
jgi:hypothetical protein